MTSERKTKPDETQTWGYYENLKPGKEKVGIGEDWFNAGYIDSYRLDDEESVNSLHALLNSFNNQVRQSKERPFRLVIVPAVTRVEPGGSDSNEMIVKLEPDYDDTAIEELREYADNLRIK